MLKITVVATAGALLLVASSTRAIPNAPLDSGGPIFAISDRHQSLEAELIGDNSTLVEPITDSDGGDHRESADRQDALADHRVEDGRSHSANPCKTISGEIPDYASASAPAPEPKTMFLVGVALIALSLMGSRRRQH